jgi:hypothetical protein
MKTPTLLRSIATDLDRGDAAVVQLVSTGESLMERRLTAIPVAEWANLSIDITPREYVLDYLAKGFPTQLYERYADEEGNILSRPVVVDGQPVQSREAVDIRDRLIEKLAALPPVQTALDQILHHFGTDQVAEVTGRNRRIVKKLADGHARLGVDRRRRGPVLQRSASVSSPGISALPRKGRPLAFEGGEEARAAGGG